VAVFAQKTFGKQQRWLGNVLMVCKNFETCGQPRETVRNFRNSIPEINVFHLIFKQDFRNFRQMESAHTRAEMLARAEIIGVSRNRTISLLRFFEAIRR
jgi:hypothetical protein